MPRVITWGAVALLAAFYTYFARLTFAAGPTHDDLMNLHRAAITPWPSILKECVFFFLPSDQYRPVGAVFYRAIHDIFGFTSFAYHLCMFLLWPLGLYFVYDFIRRVSGSREIAAFATLINLHHSNRVFYYINAGFIYDVLCQLFFFAAAGYYVRIREAGTRPSQRQLAALAALLALGLGSKEMAVSLPVLILAYELLTHKRQDWDLRFTILSGVMTAAFILGRVYGRDGLASVNAYVPTAGWQLYLEGWADWLGNLLYHRQPLTLMTSALVLAGLAVTSWLSCDRAVRLGAILALVGVLPVAFIRPMRGLEAICIPTAGLALIAGWWIARLSLVFPHAWRAPALFVLLAVVLADLHARKMPPREAVLAEGVQIESVKTQLLRVHSPMRPNARVLFAKDPFPMDFRWATTFLLQIEYGPGLQVDRADFLAAPADWSAYDHVFCWENGRLFSVHDQTASSR